MIPGLLTGTGCLVVVFVEAGNKEKEPCLVRRKKIKLGSEHNRLRYQSVSETSKWRHLISSCVYIYLECGAEVGLEI